MLIYVPLNRSCGTFSCAFYTYVLLPTSPGTFSCAFYTYVLFPTSPGIFQCTFSTYVPPATFTETFWLTYSLYVPKTQGNAQEKGMFPHRNIPSFIYVFIFPVLSVHCCPHPLHDRPHYDLLIHSRTTMPHPRPTQQLLLQLR